MGVEEIRKEVRRMCEDAGLNFFFVCSSPNASEWSVDCDDHIRKLVDLHKELEASGQ